MNQLTNERRVQVVKALIEGMSIRSTVRMTGVAKNTIVKLLAELGNACMDYQDAHLVNLPCKRLEADEIWSFVYAKAKNVPAEHLGEFGYGDVWTWTAIDADTKVIPCWYLGRRDGADALAFMTILASRIAGRVQLTTDGHKAYLQAVEGAFGADIDYAMLIKLYGAPDATEKRYSPSECLGTETKVIRGDPDKSRISTSYVERQNLTMRMSMRRFTRLTNGFSKKLENLQHNLALYFMYYNFARPHQTLSRPYQTTPALAAGVSDHVWTVEEIVSLLDHSN
ncbi:MAG: DDE-type integrase/transposase/recombinase [Candidatus Liptonbacteria bacterium]|nr:DDE-type integrase/transposase/recombinase [Candidatus Liptonbacteria bacterium]